MSVEFLSNQSDIIGILGVILLLVAFYLLTINKLTAGSLNYQFLNFTGSGLILFSLMFDWNLPAVIIEVAWMVISVIGIYRIFNRLYK